MCVTSLLCGPRADLWPFYGFLCERFSLYIFLSFPLLFFSLTIAYERPDLRGNLRNTIAFEDSQRENKPVKEGLNGVVAFTVIG